MIIFKIKTFIDHICLPLYYLGGRRPWTLGYYTAKKKAILNGIQDGVMAESAGLPPGYGSGIDERVVEYPWLFSKLPSKFERLLDAGSALNHDFLLGINPLASADLTIMTLSPEKRCFWNRAISYVFGDLRNTFFSNGAFDVIASISTIEHIGLDNTLHYTTDASKKESDSFGFIPAIKEFKRLLKSEGVCLISVPFGRRGVHGWYQVFDKEMVNEVINHFSPSSYSIEYFGYLNSEWSRVDISQIHDAIFFDSHAGGGAPKDLAAGARGVACIRMVA